MNINDIVSKITDDNIDAVIDELVRRKRNAAVIAPFEALFNSGHILEVQYGENSIVYFDRIVNQLCNSIELGIFGTNGTATAYIEIDNREDEISFGKMQPICQCNHSVITFNKNKTAYKIRNLVSCVLQRGKYLSNIGGSTSVECDTMRRLADLKASCTRSAKSETNVDTNDNESCVSIETHKLYSYFKYIQKFLEEDSDRWIYLTRRVEKEINDNGFKTFRKSKMTQSINKIDIDFQTGKVTCGINDSHKAVFEFNLNDFMDDDSFANIILDKNNKWILKNTNTTLEFEFYDSIKSFSAGNRIDPIEIIKADE